MRLFRRAAPAGLAATAAVALAVGAGPASPAAATAQPAAGPAARVQVAGTAPAAGAAAAPLRSGRQVRVAVFTGRDPAGLAALARAVSTPGRPGYRHYLSPAQVQARFGATAGQQRAISRWLAAAGLTVRYRTPFTVSATGTAARAAAALDTGLAASRPAGGAGQIVSTRAITVPAALAGAIGTIRISPLAVPAPEHEPLSGGPGAGAPAPAAGTGTSAAPARPAAAVSKEICSAYYGQRIARQVPRAYGRAPAWAPCGYRPQQVRGAYGATRSGLTGRGVTVAILSGDDNQTTLSDANRWARDRNFPPYAPGQFRPVIAAHAYQVTGDVESSLDAEAIHNMAPDATVDYVTGSGAGTGDSLLGGMEMIVARHLADVVSCSWFEGYLGWYEGHPPVPQSEIDSWEPVLERAAVEGISVNFATGDHGRDTPLQYPGSDPWITLVGGTSLAIGAHDRFDWETAWETDQAPLGPGGTRWYRLPGFYAEGSTGGISREFAEPWYQRGVVTGNQIGGQPKRAVPDVAAFGDWNLGYQVGATEQVGPGRFRYVSTFYGGTSTAVQLLGGMEADLIQGRHGEPLGFFNPALYAAYGTPALRDDTASTGHGTQAVVIGPYSQDMPPLPTLSTMAQCSAARPSVPCGPGYDLSTGLGSPGPAFFSSFGSRPR